MDPQNTNYNMKKKKTVLAKNKPDIVGLASKNKKKAFHTYQGNISILNNFFPLLCLVFCPVQCYDLIEIQVKLDHLSQFP